MIKAEIPQNLQPLYDMAMNYYWSWTHSIWPLYKKVNEEEWEKSGNPVTALKNANPTTLSTLNEDKDFVAKVNKANEEFTTYMTKENTWYNKEFGKGDDLVAYFSAEYGIHESLPIYSGGLGVLSGDHTKSSSDLGIPMAFVGLFYKNGYFIQQIDKDGKQVDVYNLNSPDDMSLTPALDENGEKIMVSVDLAGEEVFIQTWKAQIGRNTLYLLDTNVEKNSKRYQDLTARLYGGDRTMRIEQEIVLGIGGIRLLNALKLRPTSYHMNEGHSGFFQLERVLNAMKEKELSFEEAKVLCSSNCVFTTHTPVPAGNETFELPLMHKYFYNYMKQFDISWHRFVDLGLVNHKTDWKEFSLTIFALNFSRFHNGVSELHGNIAKKMWRLQWKDVPECDNPITSITNGVHVKTWTSDHFKSFFASELGEDWAEKLSDHKFWDAQKGFSKEKVKTQKSAEKADMIAMVRKQLKAQLKRNGESQADIDAVDSYLNPNALTIGFARRFATYKRATLIFKDLNRLSAIVNNPDYPVQFIFAGKAHPADVPGQKFIEEIYKISRQEEFKGKVIILENYDMSISRKMVSGVDVWLNNPRRPMEASGTSGQKVPLNFGLNFSVLDGWWREGYNEANGWTIGTEKDYPSDEVQDFEDANDFYKTLEETIRPLYYKNNKGGGSDEWFDKTIESLTSNISRFSMWRMVQDYMTKLYAPSIAYGKTFEESLEKTKNYVTTRRFLKRNWETINVTGVDFNGSVIKVESDYDQYKNTPSHHTDFPVDSTIPGTVYESVETGVDLTVYMGEMNPEKVKTELVITSLENNSVETQSLELKEDLGGGVYKLQTKFASADKKPRRLRVRFVPTLDGLSSKFELGFTNWL